PITGGSLQCFGADFHTGRSDLPEGGNFILLLRLEDRYITSVGVEDLPSYYCGRDADIAVEQNQVSILSGNECPLGFRNTRDPRRRTRHHANGIDQRYIGKTNHVPYQAIGCCDTTGKCSAIRKLRYIIFNNNTQAILEISKYAFARRHSSRPHCIGNQRYAIGSLDLVNQLQQRCGKMNSIGDNLYVHFIDKESAFDNT